MILECLPYSSMFVEMRLLEQAVVERGWGIAQEDKGAWSYNRKHKCFSNY